MTTRYRPLTNLLRRINKAGGFINSHAHFDRAYTLSPSAFERSNDHLFSKWVFVDDFKRNASVSSYEANIKTAIEEQKKFGVQGACTFIDIDTVVSYTALTAANIVKENLQDFNLVIACQTLKGVKDKDNRTLIEDVLDDIDIIGSLPRADEDISAHLDIVMDWAKQTGNRLHVHVDQLNTNTETETELLANKTIEHGLEGKVTAIHGISIACHGIAYRKALYSLCADAGLSFITCPSAWIDHKRNETKMPFHNAITPVDELIEHGLTVAIGSDNINDVYKPYCNGDMLNELRLLIDGCRLYNEEELFKIAVDNGKEVCGIL